MNKIKIIFVRHGQTDQNISMRSGEKIKEENRSLNNVGIKQAEEARDKLKDYSFDAIISSPLKRAIETTDIINQYHDLPIIIEEDLHEIKAGPIDKKDWSNMFNMDLIKENDNKFENVEIFFQRIYDRIDKIIDKYDQKTVLIVSHNGVHQAFHAYFNKIPWKGDMNISRIGNCEIKEYEIIKGENNEIQSK